MAVSYGWASLVAQRLKHPPTVWETWVWSLFDPWVRKIPWRRKWQPTPVFLPGESHGQRNLVGPWGRKESDTTEWLHSLILRLSRMSSVSFKTESSVLVLSSLTKPRPRNLSGMFKSTQTLISLFPGVFFLFTLQCSLSALPAELSLQAQESYVMSQLLSVSP